MPKIPLISSFIFSKKYSIRIWKFLGSIKTNIYLFQIFTMENVKHMEKLGDKFLHLEFNNH